MDSDTPRTDAESPNLWVVPAEFAKQLERELAAAIKQRDEARREACQFEAIVRWNEAPRKGSKSPAALFRIAREIAAERGWDCYETEEGGGA